MQAEGVTQSRREKSLAIETLAEADHEEVARLIHVSLVDWYQRNLGQGKRFGESHEPFRLIPEVYAKLDPGEALVARDSRTRAIMGVCFVHPRPTHLAVGIVAIAASAQGRGVARALLEPVVQRAGQERKPLRLVSSALNLDSFSLYTRLGFVPHTLYQDMTLCVPAGGLRAPPPEGIHRVRAATRADTPHMARLELALQGVSREQDYRFFLEGGVGDWRTWVYHGPLGDLRGFLVSSHDERSPITGPGVAVDDEAAMALLWVSLHSLRERTQLFLLPCAAGHLVRTAYAWGARNVELHVAQCLGPCAPAKGISFPTFLPESG